MRVKIIVDSAAMVPDLTAVDLDIGVVPTMLHMGGESLADNVDIRPDEFYRRLADGERATVAAPEAEAFAAQIDTAADEGYEAVLLIVSCSSPAGTLPAAVQAAAGASIPIHVFDGDGAATGLVAVAAARAAVHRVDLEVCVQRATDVTAAMGLLGGMAGWRYYRRTRRLRGPVQGVAGVLQLRPMFRLRSGTIKVSGLVTSERSVIDRLTAAMLAGSGSGALRVEVFHAANQRPADELARRVRAAGRPRELFVGPLTPAIGAYTGPGAIGASWWRS